VEKVNRKKVNRSGQVVVNGFFFWALTLSGMGLFFLVVVLPVVRQRETMEVMVEQMTARNVSLYDELDRLEKERAALLGDAFYVEKLARRELKMSRPGEMQVTITPAGYERHRQSAREHMTTTRAVGLWKLYGVLKALAEDNLLRQAALVLGGLTVIAAILLFGPRLQTRRTA
jgi:cell division protein FtsB